MKHFAATMSVLFAVVSVSCHKSAGPATLSGAYVEISPVAGSSTLNFVSATTVIVTGASFFLEPLSAPDTLNYFLSSGSNGPTISFVTINPDEKDTLSCNYAVMGSAQLDLSFRPCPEGIPCYALGGTNFLFTK
jgi:hypothetical protein